VSRKNHIPVTAAAGSASQVSPGRQDNETASRGWGRLPMDRDRGGEESGMTSGSGALAGRGESVHLYPRIRRSPRTGVVRSGLGCLLAGAAVALALVSACSRDDEAREILELVREGVQRAEQRDVAGLLAMTAGGFRAEPGARDRAAAGESIEAAFYYYGRFRILHPEPAVELSEDRRTAAVSVPFLIVKRDRSWPDLDGLYRDPEAWLDRVGANADLYRLDVRLVRSQGGWFAESARLGSLRTADFLR